MGRIKKSLAVTMLFMVVGVLLGLTATGCGDSNISRSYDIPDTEVKSTSISYLYELDEPFVETKKSPLLESIRYVNYYSLDGNEYIKENVPIGGIIHLYDVPVNVTKIMAVYGGWNHVIIGVGVDNVELKEGEDYILPFSKSSYVPASLLDTALTIETTPVRALVAPKDTVTCTVNAFWLDTDNNCSSTWDVTKHCTFVAEDDEILGGDKEYKCGFNKFVALKSGKSLVETTLSDKIGGLTINRVCESSVTVHNGELLGIKFKRADGFDLKNGSLQVVKLGKTQLFSDMLTSNNYYVGHGDVKAIAVFSSKDGEVEDDDCQVDFEISSEQDKAPFTLTSEGSKAVMSITEDGVKGNISTLTATYFGFTAKADFVIVDADLELTADQNNINLIKNGPEKELAVTVELIVNGVKTGITDKPAPVDFIFINEDELKTYMNINVADPATKIMLTGKEVTPQPLAIELEYKGAVNNNLAKVRVSSDD